MKNKTEQNVTNKKPSKRKYIIAAVCFVLLVIVALIVSAIRWEPKPDLVSEIVIRHAAAIQLKMDNDIKKDPNDLTEEDFAKITKLDIRSSFPRRNEFSDIRFLENLINLEELYLNKLKFPEGKIPKWAKFLASLGIYNINEKYTIDLKPLEKLNKLESLYITNSDISDIEPLKKLINLKYLSLSGSTISNIESIEKFKRLKNLDLRGCDNITDKQIKDLYKTSTHLFIYPPSLSTEIMI